MGKIIQLIILELDPHPEVSFVHLKDQLKIDGHCRRKDYIEEIDLNLRDFKRILKRIVKERRISIKEALSLILPYYKNVLGSDFFNKIEIRV